MSRVCGRHLRYTFRLYPRRAPLTRRICELNYGTGSAQEQAGAGFRPAGVKGGSPWADAKLLGVGAEAPRPRLAFESGYSRRTTLSGDWRAQLEERLSSAADATGAWGYAAGNVGAAEPTALAAIALATNDAYTAPVERGLAWLAAQQGADGALSVSPVTPGPYWPTSLALLAWSAAEHLLQPPLPPGERLGEGQLSRAVSTLPQPLPAREGSLAAPSGAALPNKHKAALETATQWLLNAHGEPIAHAPALDHDTTLIGWPWVAGSHSWVEPTGYAVLALRARGLAAHPRVREAVKLILNRALPDGGWNYGNRRVFGQALRAFPATTGVALAALAGEPRSAEVDAGIAYLADALPQISAPLSLSWGLVGLQAWEARPAAAEAWLARAAQRLIARPAQPHYLALLLIAGAGRDVLVAQETEPAHG